MYVQTSTWTLSRAEEETSGAKCVLTQWQPSISHTFSLPLTLKVSSDITSCQCHEVHIANKLCIPYIISMKKNKKNLTAIITGVKRAHHPPLSPNPLRAHTLKQMAQERCRPNQLFTQL